MNTYILLSMLCLVSIYASDEPLDTSPALELLPKHGVVSVFYTEEKKASSCLTIKLHAQGIAYLRRQRAPLRVSVPLNRNENSISLGCYDEYYFVPLPDAINLAIIKEAIDFSIDENIYSIIESLPKGAALYLSYKMSQEQANALRAIEKNLEEIDAQERSPIVRLRRLISQEYKGPL